MPLALHRECLSSYTVYLQYGLGCGFTNRFPGFSNKKDVQGVFSQHDLACALSIVIFVDIKVHLTVVW